MVSMARKAKTRKPREVRADGAETRERILEAAGRTFAASGYADATAKSVAKRARVSLTSINYHFKGRQGLYRAVLVEAHSRLISLTDLRDLDASKAPPAAKLEALIEQLVRQATSPQAGWHMDVLARESLAPSPHIVALFETAVPPKLEIVIRVLSEITAIPPGEPALLRCFLSTLAPCIMLLLVARGAPGPLHDLRRMSADTITRHLLSFALAGLKAISREYRTSSLPRRV